MGAGATVGVGVGAGEGDGVGAGLDPTGALQDAWATVVTGPETFAADGGVASDPATAGSTTAAGSTETTGAPVVATPDPPVTLDVAPVDGGCSIASAAMIEQVAATLSPTVNAREAGAAEDRFVRLVPLSDIPVRWAADRGVSEVMG